ncbi:MAG: hypothetical protein ABI673_04650 [Novosphingobium sp.]
MEIELLRHCKITLSVTRQNPRHCWPGFYQWHVMPVEAELPAHSFAVMVAPLHPAVTPVATPVVAPAVPIASLVPAIIVANAIMAGIVIAARIAVHGAVLVPIMAPLRDCRRSGSPGKGHSQSGSDNLFHDINPLH